MCLFSFSTEVLEEGKKVGLVGGISFVLRF